MPVIHQNPITYCYFSFANAGNRHDVRMWVTPSLTMEWKLYINDKEVGVFQDPVTNVLIEQQLSDALSYPNVKRIYVELLQGAVNG